MKVKIGKAQDQKLTQRIKSSSTWGGVNIILAGKIKNDYSFLEKIIHTFLFDCHNGGKDGRENFIFDKSNVDLLYRVLCSIVGNSESLFMDKKYCYVLDVIKDFYSWIKEKGISLNKKSMSLFDKYCFFLLEKGYDEEEKKLKKKWFYEGGVFHSLCKKDKIKPLEKKNSHQCLNNKLSQCKNENKSGDNEFSRYEERKNGHTVRKWDLFFREKESEFLGKEVYVEVNGVKEYGKFIKLTTPDKKNLQFHGVLYKGEEMSFNAFVKMVKSMDSSKTGHSRWNAYMHTFLKENDKKLFEMFEELKFKD